MTVLRAGTVIDGKYELVRLLGEGGMGSVWRCRHLQLGAPFAVKFLRSDLGGARSQHRFELEARAAAGLRTRHVVRIYDHGVQDQAYIVMELLEGEDLGARMSRVGRLPLGVAAAIALETARGLHHAHQAGIVHRDLKPANIFLAESDGEEVVKIVDFGLAKLLGPRVGEETKPGQLLGTVPYMSPEHAQGQWDQVDARADVWSLAVILYRAVTGRLPFEAPGPAELIARICAARPKAPTAIDPTLPVALDGFFARALAARPEDRFATAPELARAFATALGAAAQGLWSSASDLLDEDGVTHVLDPAARAVADDETLGPSAASRVAPPTLSAEPALSRDSTTLPLGERLPAKVALAPRPPRRRPLLPLAVGAALLLLGAAGVLAMLSGSRVPPRLGKGLAPAAAPWAEARRAPRRDEPTAPPTASATASGGEIRGTARVPGPAVPTRVPPPPAPTTDFGY